MYIHTLENDAHERRAINIYIDRYSNAYTYIEREIERERQQLYKYMLKNIGAYILKYIYIYDCITK